MSIIYIFHLIDIRVTHNHPKTCVVISKNKIRQLDELHYSNVTNIFHPYKLPYEQVSYKLSFQISHELFEKIQKIYNEFIRTNNSIINKQFHTNQESTKKIMNIVDDGLNIYFICNDDKYLIYTKKEDTYKKTIYHNISIV